MDADSYLQKLQEAGVPRGLTPLRSKGPEIMDTVWPGESRDKYLINSFLEKYDKLMRKGVGLVFLGSVPGCGKTTIASWVFCKLMAHHNVTGAWITEHKLKDAILSSESWDEDEKFRDRLLDVRVLLLDAIKAPRDNRFTSLTWEFLSDREQRKHITLVTLNCRETDLKGHEDAEVLKALGVPVLMGNTDFRGKRRKEMFRWIEEDGP